MYRFNKAAADPAREPRHDRPEHDGQRYDTTPFFFINLLCFFV